MHSLIKPPLKCLQRSVLWLLEGVSLVDVELVDRSDVPFFILLHLIIHIPW